MRTFVIFSLYGLALAFIYAGTQTAPQIGWPRTDVEVGGCALLVLGMILKMAGHWQLLELSPRVRRYH